VILKTATLFCIILVLIVFAIEIVLLVGDVSIDIPPPYCIPEITPVPEERIVSERVVPVDVIGVLDVTGAQIDWFDVIIIIY
jgi:hypothetical protein